MKIVTRARDPRPEFRCVLRFAAETRARLVIGCLPLSPAEMEIVREILPPPLPSSRGRVVSREEKPFRLWPRGMGRL